MDDDVASAATQLFGGGQGGLLVVDAKELLSSTARVVGVQFGELHLKVLMALVTLHVASGLPEDGRGSSTIGELNRLISGEDRERGGGNTKRLLGALFDLFGARFTVPGYDMVNQRPTAGVSGTSLLGSLVIDETILRAYNGEAPNGLNRREFEALGAKRRGTVSWRWNPDYAQRLAESDLRRFDWTKAQQLRGVALALWMVFTSPRVPYRPMLEGREKLEMVEIPLSLQHCHALGVRNSADAGRRRTLSQAGARVCAADRSFVAFEAHGGHGQESFLRIVRTPQADPPLEPARVATGEQLTLAA
jgi:hypothetical protein